VPAGTGWIHEVKHDGYRMLLIRDQHRVRLISRGRYDWADRFPLIVATATLRAQRFIVTHKRHREARGIRHLRRF
jgi:bifunctional non-homologous end joining protein LigD